MSNNRSYSNDNPFANFSAEDIARYNNALYDAANEPEPARRTAPEGDYTALVYYMNIEDVMEKYGYKQINVDFQIIEGEYAGAVLRKRYPIQTDRLNILQREFKRMGIGDVNDIRDYGEVENLEKVINSVVNITVKHRAKSNGNGYYLNIYVNDYVGKGESYMDESPAQEIDDPECPF